MAKQTTKPVGKKAVTASTNGKPKTSKATVVAIAKSPAAKKPAMKKLAGKITKSATALPKKSAASVVKKATIPVAEKKALAKKPPTKKIAEKKSKPAVNRKTLVKPTLEERNRMVEVAAYFIAEQHGFEGRADEYWVAAEQQIAASLGL